MNKLIRKLSAARSREIRLSQDAILFILVWGALFWLASLTDALPSAPANSVVMTASLLRILTLDPLPAVWLVLLMGYVVADVWFGGALRTWAKRIALWGMILGFVIFPSIAAMIFRQNSAPYLYIHDGAIQVEEAVHFFVQGQNPYSVTYFNTPMAQWPFKEEGTPVNPALYHVPYLPVLWLSTLPFETILRVLLGWYDVRIVYLLEYVASALLILESRIFSPNQFSAAIAFALNPIFLVPFIEGRNDVVVSFWLLIALLFVMRSKFIWAGIAFAAALLSKQTAWFVLPFLGMFIWQQSNSLQIARRKMVVPILGLSLLVLVPFLVWDARAFGDDVIAFQSGVGGGVIYPIKSLGLGSLALGSGLVTSTAQFPFGWFQLIFGGVTLLYLLFYQRAHNTARQVFINYALLLFVISFFSRTFNDNHLAFALTWVILAFLVNEGQVNDPVTVSVLRPKPRTLKWADKVNNPADVGMVRLPLCLEGNWSQIA